MTDSCKLELLSPCKNADIGIEAINHGADAVYVGGPLFSARAQAGNSLQDLERLAKYAHRFNCRVYLALNTILTDQQIPEAVKIANEAWNMGIDALIIQDMGLLMCDLPPIELHASTQCDIRTPEKAKFLESVGFSQIVLARELGLKEISVIHKTLSRSRIEFFVHGALCVSYSGQCYASQALKGRSANRGECAQICRLPFDLYDDDGQCLIKNRHLLSLKDNNQSQNISSLIASGVRSFKIEGRYKDMAYVKNTTAFYRKLIDEYLQNHSGYERQSDGTFSYSFTPSLEDSFNRGATDYFVNGRREKMSASDTPKNAGRTIGKVLSLRDRSFLLKSHETINNSDGLSYFTDTGELEGLLVNRASLIDENLWEIFTREPVSRIPGLRSGMEVMRNKDSAWIKRMKSNTALRQIPIRIEARVSQNTLQLDAFDHQGNHVSKTLRQSFEAANNPDKARQQILHSLSKLGGTEFVAEDIQIEDNHEARFLSVSIVNGLRRSLLEALSEKRSDLKRLSPVTNNGITYPVGEIDYRGNVANDKAREFYSKHGVKVTENAFELGSQREIVELMRCKYCIRYELGLCPKQAKERGERIKPTPLKLKHGKIELTANFHCKPCEMSINGKVN